VSEATLFVLLFGIPLAIVWGFVLVDLVRRPGLPSGKKIIWAVSVLLLAEIGALIYVFARPLRYPGDEIQADAGSDEASGFLAAAESHLHGDIGDAEMDRIKATLLRGLVEGD
jgi:hypothetical protein